MSEPLRLLVVDDDRRMAKTLVDILRVKGYQAEAAHSGREALEKVSAGDLDCVLSDIRMPDVNGVELCQAIRRVRPDLPVVLMTAYASDGLVEEGLEEGAIAALTKPLNIGLLLMFFSFLRKRRALVIVEDDPQFCRTLADILQMRGFAVTRISDAREVLERLGVGKEVLLLDMVLGRISSLDVLRAIRERHPHLPMVLVTAHRKEMAPAIEAALELDAYTCLYKPLEIEELVQTLTELRRQEMRGILGARPKSIL